MNPQVKVLFVCLGNICRSPAAEGIFRELVEQNGLQNKILVDSAGTGGWHEGEGPDDRMIFHAKKRGYDLSDLIGRQIKAPHDLETYDYILTMDDSNLKNVRALDSRQMHHQKIRPLVEYCKIHSVKEVPDPYYKGEEGFEYVLDLLEDACFQLLETVKKDLR